MSFTRIVKDEILRNTAERKYLIRCELEAFFQHTVSFPELNTIIFKTENKIVAERFINDIYIVYNINLFGIFDFESEGKNTYEFEITNEEIFNDGLKANNISFLETEMSSDHKKSYIKGIFLILGYILNPEKEYHIEFSFINNIYVDLIKDILKGYNIHVKTIKRKSVIILYIKDSEQISTFLSLVGAFNALMEMENIKIYKDVRNTINRNVNCETANLKKTINASIKQIESINKIIKSNRFNSLTPQLKEVAEARLANEDLNLSELAATLGITKSCINHRLRKLIEISEEV